MDKILIKLENINFAYNGRKQILSDLNLTLKQKEKIGITGPIGCGKTTLLYLIMGLLKPASGNIKIFSQERTDEEDFIYVRKKIGFLFQNPDDQIFCPVVAEDIAFGPLNLGLKEKEVQAIVKNTLKRLSLDAYEHRITYKLSYGEKKLVALAGVLAMNPKILILDEPTNGLDKHYKDKLINILEKEFSSYIIVSHEKEILKKLCTTIYELKNSTLKAK